MVRRYVNYFWGVREGLGGWGGCGDIPAPGEVKKHPVLEPGEGKMFRNGVRNGARNGPQNPLRTQQEPLTRQLCLVRGWAVEQSSG